jgi:phage shock protein PspC (stress-responsive transcriptional regulator)
MNTGYKQLTRSTSNRMIAGVCAGFGEYLGIDPTIVRLLTLLAFFTALVDALVYLIMAIVVPEQTTVQQ